MPSKETFHFEVKDLIMQFEDFLNNVVIRRYDDDRIAQDKIKVDLVYGHKQRVLQDIVNKQGHIQIPIIAVTMGSLKRDKTRVFNKLDGSYTDTFQAPQFAHLQQPVPIDLVLNVSIMTRYQIDLDQILTNFIPYTDPYVVVSWKWPDPTTNKTIEIRSAVIWNEDVTMDYPKDLQNNAPMRFIADTSFTVKGWLFKNPGDPAKKIYKIDTTFTAVSDIHMNYDLMKGMMYQNNTDTLTISARPFIIKTIPYMVSTCQPTPIILQGNMMDYVSAIYVSGTDGVYPTQTLQDPLAWNSAVSATYGAFTGLEVSTLDWAVIDKNKLSIVIPAASASGYIDIIAVNEAGYGNLIIDSSSINPSAEFRFPYESGIFAYDIPSNCVSGT